MPLITAHWPDRIVTYFLHKILRYQKQTTPFSFTLLILPLRMALSSCLKGYVTATSLALLAAWSFVGQDHVLRHALLLVAIQKIAQALFKYWSISLHLSSPFVILFISSVSPGFRCTRLDSFPWSIRKLIISNPSSWVTLTRPCSTAISWLWSSPWMLPPLYRVTHPPRFPPPWKFPSPQMKTQASC
jgi:hypothetical protein